jgi:hypothetical protein
MTPMKGQITIPRITLPLNIFSRGVSSKFDKQIPFESLDA